MNTAALLPEASRARAVARPKANLCVVRTIERPMAAAVMAFHMRRRATGSMPATPQTSTRKQSVTPRLRARDARGK